MLSKQPASNQAQGDNPLQDNNQAQNKTQAPDAPTANNINPISHIIIKGAKQHNLKNINVNIPKNKLVVFSGLSGSGKSTLAFDTLYAEGQRRYVESLSSYARQFLGLMDKPKVDQIEGLAPSISIDQKTTSHNPRSTVGTITEIYDYLRLLFARVGHPHCPQCGQEISTQSIDQIIQQVLAELEQRARQQPVRLMILSPVVTNRKGQFKDLLTNLRQKGYSRVRIDQQVFGLDEDVTLIKTNQHDIEAVVDRLTVSMTQLQDTEERQTIRSRLNQSLEQALELADGLVMVSFIQDESFDFPEKPTQFEDRLFSEKLACSQCGISIKEMEPRLFSFNSPEGACPTCNGLGVIMEIDPDKIIAPDLTLSEGAIIPFARTLSRDTWKARLIKKVVENYREQELQPQEQQQQGETDDNQANDQTISFRHTPFYQLPDELKQILLFGSDQIYQVTGTNRQGQTTSIEKKWEGFVNNLERRYQETDSEYMRKEIEKYQVKTTCPDCDGARLKPKALSVVVDGLNIYDINAMTITDSLHWAQDLQQVAQTKLKQQQANSQTKTQAGSNSTAKAETTLAKTTTTNTTTANTTSEAATEQASQVLTKKEAKIARPILKEIVERLGFLQSVGLDYLSLSREAATLAGGEAQRIRLASQIGTGLTGVLYILDEPTIGLHQRDNQRLIDTLKELRDKGNSVLVVEHDREVIEAADHIVDFGPRAGEHGGQIVAQGPAAEIVAQKTLTGQYLARNKQISRGQTQTRQKSAQEHIQIKGASLHNLKSIDIQFPVGKLTCVTGVSGSGKSSLVHDTLYYHLVRQLSRRNSQQEPGPIKDILVPQTIGRVKLIDQSPIGRTPRSNPATYTKIFDYIRKIFANTKEAQIRGYKVGRFSFNVKGGRCEACQGQGQTKIEMQFLPDVYVKCDVCQGQRYNQETLQIKYQDKNIADVLDMTIEEAYHFFQRHSTLRRKLKTLVDVGLGYLQLGQPAPTLSGGEAQRIKISRELAVSRTDHIAYLLDEPTTGLHFADVQKLIHVLHRLVEQGNTVIVIEHNLDVIKNADWIIDLGPEGGAAGGEVVATGTPEQVSQNDSSYTGIYLEEELEEIN
jgi:excinuclease ABC subunit A